MAARNQTMQFAGWVNVLLGLLVFATPFWTGDMLTETLWNNLATGTLVVILAGYNIYEARQRHAERAYGPSILNVLVGLWLVASPFVLAASTAYMASNVIYGAVLVIAAGYNTYASSQERMLARPTG